jgi:hypothetical protein
VIHDRTRFTTFFVTRDQNMELVSLRNVDGHQAERQAEAFRSRPTPLSCATSSRAAPFSASPTQRPATMAYFLYGSRRKLVDEDRPFVIKIDRKALWQNIGERRAGC